RQLRSAVSLLMALEKPDQPRKRGCIILACFFLRLVGQTFLTAESDFSKSGRQECLPHGKNSRPRSVRPTFNQATRASCDDHEGLPNISGREIWSNWVKF